MSGRLCIGAMLALALAAPSAAAPAKPQTPAKPAPAARKPAARRPAAKAAAAAPAPARLSSRLTEVTIRSTAPAETDGYVRITGTVRGVVDPGEQVVGLDTARKTSDGQVEYRSDFELVAPAEGRNEAIFVEAENRGAPTGWRALGPGFLPARATSYARVQWQTGVSRGVPARAQGIGLVVLRDFARWLAGRTPEAEVEGAAPALGYQKLILGGVSQGAWMVDTFVAEGFNVDPQGQGRVFDAAIAIDGVGEWLAINKLASDRGAAQTPYLVRDGAPLKREELLSRPKTDPFYVDVANYTDFYRLRAGLTATAASTPGFRRYDWPSAHALGAPERVLACTGRQVGTNPLDYAPYFRALVVGVERTIGVKAAAKAKPLPPSAVFTLDPNPPEASDLFNPLPGVKTPVPKTDLDGWPVGGVRFPEAALPLGRPEPAALPPVNTASMDSTCGDIGVFSWWSPIDQARRYGSASSYAMRFTRQVAQLQAQGFLLPEDAKAMKPPPEAFGGM